MLTIIIIAVYLVIVGTWIFYELKHAPKGYQDEYGFHPAETEKSEL